MRKPSYGYVEIEIAEKPIKNAHYKIDVKITDGHPYITCKNIETGEVTTVGRRNWCDFWEELIFDFVDAIEIVTISSEREEK